jgi:hypothetical protein
MSASDVDCKAAQDSQICGSVVFSTSRVILVENHVQCPMQPVFDAPMFARGAEQFGSCVALAQKEMALDRLVATTFAGDPRDRLEAGKIVIFGHIRYRSNDRGSNFLAAVSGVLGGSLFGVLVLCRRDCRLGVAQEARLVFLHPQHVISTALYDGFRHSTMTMQCIRRNDAPLQLKKLDELQAPATSLFPGASALASARRVFALHAVTITGGM